MGNRSSAPSPPQLRSPKLSMIELAQLGNLLNLSLNPLESYDQAFPQFLRQQALLPGLTNFARAANQANQSLIEQLAPGSMQGLSSAGERISGLVSDSDKVRGLARPVQDNAGRMAAQSQTAFDNASRTAGTVDDILANARRTGQQADPLFGLSDQISGTVQPVLDRANTAMASGDSLVRGQIPQDVLDQIYNSSAFAALATGTGAGSPMNRRLQARDIGTTSLGLQDVGLNRYSAGANLFGQGANLAGAAGNLRGAGANMLGSASNQLGQAGSQLAQATSQAGAGVNMLGAANAEFSRAGNLFAQGGDMERAAFDQYRNVLGTAAGLNAVNPTDMMFTPADVLARMDANTALANQEANFNTNLVNYRTTYNNDIENQQRYYNTGIRNEQAIMDTNTSNANAMNKYNYDLMKYQQNQGFLGGLGGTIGAVVGGGLGIMGGPAGVLAGASLGNALGGGIGTAAGGGGFGGFSSGLVSGLSGLASIGRSDSSRYGVLSDIFAQFGRR